MQFLIDTDNESPATLRQCGEMLIFLAGVPAGTGRDKGVDDAPVVLPSFGVVVVPPAPPADFPRMTLPVMRQSTLDTFKDAEVVVDPPFVPAPPPPPTYVENTAKPPDTVTIVSPPANVQLDKASFPYDARIHAATPSINASNGLWRQRRNLDNATLEAVEAELRARGYGVTRVTAALPVSVPPPPSTVMVPPPPPPFVPAPPVAPPAPAATVMVPPPPQGAAGLLPGNGPGVVAPPDMFRVLMGKLKGQTGETGPLRPEILKPVYAEFKVAGPQDFHKRRDEIPAFLARIDQLLGV